MGNYSEKLKDSPLGLSFNDVLLIPQYSDVKLGEMDVSTRLTSNLKLKIPILSSPMDTVTGPEMALAMGEMGGLGILPRNLNLDEVLKAIDKLHEEGLPIGVAVGPFDDDKVTRLAEKEVDIVVIDTAHGHSRNVLEAVKRFKREYGVEVMAGNVATGEGAEALIEAGADSLRVGIGPGHACTTREVAGVGVPQLTAVAWVADVASEYEVSVVADGGIEKPADIVKALAAGADAVMLGYLLAGTDEAPGEVLRISGKVYKKYRGMGSKGALASGSARYGEFKKVPEGVEGYVEYRGSLREILEYLVGGLKQGMGYLGAKNLGELKAKARFVRITPAGAGESKPRGIILADELWL
ncbi:MAG: guanosine monophosphate reductase [Thermoprotei archaeon]|nr:MAG: guanosine monophosphate reductase [Thermoprotei archaeon]